MREIVVGIDGTAPADAALAFALEEARLRNVPLRIVCAWQVPPSEYVGAAFASAADLAATAERHAREVLERAMLSIGDEPGVQVEAVAANGSAPRVLVEQSADATLLVVGTRGHGVFASLVLGSVSRSLAGRGLCPVVIVRHAGSNGSGTPIEGGASERADT